MLRSRPVPTLRNASGAPRSSCGASADRADQCSRANTQASPRSSAWRNSRNGVPLPQQVTDGAFDCLASWKRRIRAGSTWLPVG